MRWICLIGFSFIIWPAKLAFSQDAKNPIEQHPAVLVQQHLLKPYRDPSWWDDKLRAAQEKAKHRYPCHSQVQPVVHQFMHYQILQALTSEAFAREVTVALSQSMSFTELQALSKLLQANQPQSYLLTRNQTQQEQLKTHHQLSKAIIGKAIKQAESQVRQQTEQKLPDIIKAYATPDGACKAR